MTILLTNHDVERLVADSDEALLDLIIDRVRTGYELLDRGDVRVQDRTYLRFPSDADRFPAGLFVMSALIGDGGWMGSRLAAIGAGRHFGGSLVALFDHVSAECVAIIAGRHIHGLRTSAPAALASQHLARHDARSIACLGSGGIARGGLEMLRRVLPQLSDVRVYSPHGEHRRAFAEQMSDRHALRVRVCDDATTALDGAEVVLLATSSDVPVVRDADIVSGVHICSLGRGEVPDATLARSKVVHASLASEAALDPRSPHPVSRHVVHAELADVVLGRAVGRESSEEITVFLGGVPNPMWDVATAGAVVETARKLGVGTEIDLH